VLDHYIDEFVDEVKRAECPHVEASRTQATAQAAPAGSTIKPCLTPGVRARFNGTPGE